MAKLTQIVFSTTFNKFLMALTGFLLGGFITAHLVGNMQLFIGAEQYNKYAAFLKSISEILWILRAVMILSFAVHIWTSMRLKIIDLKAKPSPYAVKKYLKAKFSSRTMIWTGSMVGAFVLYHLSHLTLGLTNPKLFLMKDALGREDVFSRVVWSFSNYEISGVYIFALIVLGFHINHAVLSMFQTLGILSNPRIESILKTLSPIFAFAIAAGYISIPVCVLAGIIQ